MKEVEYVFHYENGNATRVKVDLDKGMIFKHPTEWDWRSSLIFDSSKNISVINLSLVTNVEIKKIGWTE
jgi:hypothetical protein